jgi:hypothetical protein
MKTHITACDQCAPTPCSAKKTNTIALTGSRGEGSEWGVRVCPAVWPRTRAATNQRTPDDSPCCLKHIPVQSHVRYVLCVYRSVPGVGVHRAITCVAVRNVSTVGGVHT